MFAIPTDKFQGYQWKISRELNAVMKAKFEDGEVKTVRELCEKINSQNEYDFDSSALASNSMKFSVETKAAFLHNSRVKAEENTKQKELADMAVISSYKENGTIQWQRICFIQNKMDREIGVKIDKEQLFILNLFPHLVSKSPVYTQENEYLLQNLSGMLGAYGFISKHGEMTVISARTLAHMLGGGPHIFVKDLTGIIVSEQASRHYHSETRQQSPFDFFPQHLNRGECMECREYFHYFFRHGSWPAREILNHLEQEHGLNSYDVFGGNHKPEESVLSCLGTPEFVRSWTEFKLGEIVFEDDKSEYSEDLRKIIKSIRSSCGFIKEPPKDEFHLSLDDNRSLIVLETTVNVTRRENQDNRG